MATKEEVIRVRVTKEDKELVTQRASENNMTLSEYVYKRVVEENGPANVGSAP